MEKTIEIKANPKEVAQLLFDLDNEQVAQVFSEWKILFDKEIQRMRSEGKTVWTHDLNHFMLYVVDKMDDDAKDMIRNMYAQLVYRLVDDVVKTQLNIM